MPSFVDIIPCTSLGLPCWCPESTCPMDSSFQGTSCENLIMYDGSYQHTCVLFYVYPGGHLLFYATMTDI